MILKKKQRQPQKLGNADGEALYLTLAQKNTAVVQANNSSGEDNAQRLKTLNWLSAGTH